MKRVRITTEDTEDAGDGRNPVQRALERAGHTVLESNQGAAFLPDTGSERPGEDLALLHSRELSRWLGDGPATEARNAGRDRPRHFPGHSSPVVVGGSGLLDRMDLDFTAPRETGPTGRNRWRVR